MSLNYYIQNDIKLLEWPAYSLDLNPIENIWANIKNKLGSRVYNNKDTLEADIKYYWNVNAKDYSEIVVHLMRKRINASILKGGKRTGYLIFILVFFMIAIYLAVIFQFIFFINFTLTKRLFLLFWTCLEYPKLGVLFITWCNFFHAGVY